MASNNKYTKQEDDIIVKHISNNMGNITKACNELAIKLDRSSGAISVRWYTKLSKTNKCFTLFGRKTHFVNKKNEGNSKAKPKSHKISLWEEFLNLLKF